jgi:surface protein
MFAESPFNGDISNWDVSEVRIMEGIFHKTCFDQDISKWNVSNVKNMFGMFNMCQFNQDISSWNVSKLEDMNSMFGNSKFNGDISSWDVSSVVNMIAAFRESDFECDLSNWTPYNLDFAEDAFINCKAIVPYWYPYATSEERTFAIKEYIASNRYDELNDELKVNKIESAKKNKV